ncbi:hypothetical protein HX448_05430 [Dehalogenimonas etheniformans]|uniref:hypothetical protein n=1 Tax=Dehalogenimonas etheniformans TaxID=1536648 RepID=UPI00167F5DFF|nr:hypothetical protein HX448_05430 [Dehalogenimonas etheniformans]
MGETSYAASCRKDARPQELYKLVLFFMMLPKLIQKNAVLVHASSVFYKDKGFLFPAWSATGKTIMMMNFIAQRAKLIADDFTIVTAEGSLLCFPGVIYVRNPHSAKIGCINKTNLFFSSYTASRLTRWVLPSLGKVFRRLPLRTAKTIGLACIQMGKSDMCVPFPFERLFPQGEIKRSCVMDTVFCLHKDRHSQSKIRSMQEDCATIQIVSNLMDQIENNIPGLYQACRFVLSAGGKSQFEGIEQPALKIIEKALVAKPIYLVSFAWDSNPEVIVRELMQCPSIEFSGLQNA